jgi:DNA-binding transcriptional ArsR family regulator
VSDALDAGALVGLLADEDRRRVVAALVLGAATVDDVARQAGLDLPRAGKALARLVDGGLVERGDDGTLALLGQAFAHAARAAASRRDPDEVGEGVPPEAAKVLRSFVRDGRLVSIPASHSKRLVVLDRLAQEFEPGHRYSEKMVNLILGKWHADTASLRRYLVDDGFLEREAGEYWRAGGTVSLDHQP